MKNLLKLVIVTGILINSLSVFSYEAQAKDLYVVSSDKGAVLVLDSNSNGKTAALRKISGTDSTLTGNGVFGVAVYNNEVYVTDSGTKAISVFKSTDNGDVAPTRRIVGTNTKLSTPRILTIYNDYIFCADETKNAVRVFKTSDSGDVAPTREITDFAKNVYSCAVYNDELYVLDSAGVVHVFDLNADGTAAANEKRYLDVSGALTYPRGFCIADGILYASDSDQIATYTATGNGNVTPLAIIEGSNTNLQDVHALLVENGKIYAANYGDNENAIETFSISSNRNAVPESSFTGNTLSRSTSIAMDSAGYVAPSSHQQSGVNVTVTRSTENATTENVFKSTYSPPFQFSKVTPLAEFEATVDSNGANGVFSFNSTALNSTAGSYKLLKCFTTNGSSIYFDRYASSVDTDTDGAWWIEDASGNYLSSDTALTPGTNYYVNFVVKDNGKFDEDRTLGQIKDPATLGSTSSDSNGVGCVFNPAAGLSLEWIMLGLVALFSLLRKPVKKIKSC